MRKIKQLGSGLLYAGAAIGVSHLVQSTRAGADFGFTLIPVIILIHFIKYPFFQFGPKYAAATGNHLITGYAKLSKRAVWLFLGYTVATIFTIQAAVTIVTAGILSLLFPFLPSTIWAVIILLISACILVIGKFSLLNKGIKWIIIILTLTTIVTTIFAFRETNISDIQSPSVLSLFNSNNAFFLIAFMGWMPAPLDLSVWHSVWQTEGKGKSEGKDEEKGTGKQESKAMADNSIVKSALFDFNVGYWGTCFLAICFLTLGALSLFNSGEELSASGGVFAGQLIEIYTSNLGSWAFGLIALAALTTMVSTTLTCLDAFPRVLKPTFEHLFPQKKLIFNNYVFWLTITVSGTLLVIFFLLENMKTMVDVATIVSFLVAPVLAILNYKVITSNQVEKPYQPSLLMKLLSICGIVFLVGFSLYFIFERFIH